MKEIILKIIDNIVKINEFLQGFKLEESKKLEYDNYVNEWVKCGLCIPYDKPIQLAINPLKSNEVEPFLKCYLKKRKLSEIKNKLLIMEFINKDEVRFLFKLLKNKKYKVCSMIIFSFIDCVVINLQKSSTKKLPKQIKDIIPKESFNIGYLYFESSLICKLLEEYYKRADDFRNEEKYNLLNRNFLLHGMSKREISKFECVKLLLLLIFVYDYLKDVTNQ